MRSRRVKRARWAGCWRTREVETCVALRRSLSARACFRLRPERDDLLTVYSKQRVSSREERAERSHNIVPSAWASEAGCAAGCRRRHAALLL